MDTKDPNQVHKIGRICWKNPDFAKEFKRVLNNADITEADDFTPGVLEDTYVDIEISLPRYGEGPKFSKVTKCLWDANGIPIGS